jgi:hypothetical protein
MRVRSQCTVHSVSVCRIVTQLTAAETRTWGDVSVACVQLVRPRVMYLLHTLPPHIGIRQAGPYCQQRLQQHPRSSALIELPSEHRVQALLGSRKLHVRSLMYRCMMLLTSRNPDLLEVTVCSAACMQACMHGMQCTPAVR